MMILRFLIKPIIIVLILNFQLHKIIGFAPGLLQIVMMAEVDMPVRQAGKFNQSEVNLITNTVMVCNKQ